MALALFAGTGGLPPHLARTLVASGDTPVICEMEGYVSEVDPALPRLSFRMETLGTLLATLQEAGVTRVCMAGAMRRPKIDPAAIDDRTRPLVPRLLAALDKGDDGTLRAFISLFEEHGMEVIGAHQIAPDLLPSEGVLTLRRPMMIGLEVKTAQAALAEMGAADLGQALVVRGASVLAREDERGTDALLADLARPAVRDAIDPLVGLVDEVSETIGQVMDWVSGDEASGDVMTRGHRAILFKGPKPGQDRRADLPAIGPSTAAGAVRAQLAGIIIEEGGVMVLERDRVIEMLDKAGLFLVVIAP